MSTVNLFPNARINSVVFLVTELFVPLQTNVLILSLEVKRS